MNKVCLMGRLTKDPEYSMTTAGNAVVKFSLAVRQTAEKTEFFDIVAFKNTAEHVRKWFRKGQLCGITGKLSQNVWEKDGKKYSKVEVIIEEIDFAGEKKAIEEPSTPADSEFTTIPDEDLPSWMR